MTADGRCERRGPGAVAVQEPRAHHARRRGCPSPAGLALRSRGGRPVPRREAGSVTAELALALPAVVLTLVVVLLVATAAVAQVRCADAARAAARAAALGDDGAAVAAIATDLAGEDAAVSVSEAGGWVHVTVTAPVATGWLGAGSLTARAEASIPLEPGEP